MNGVCFDAISKIFADRAGRSLGRIGRAHDLAIEQNGVLAFEANKKYRPARHEMNKAVKERAILVLDIKAFSFFARELRELRCGDPEATTFESGEDFTDTVFGDSVWFYDRKSAFNGHGQTPSPVFGGLRGEVREKTEG